MDKIKTIRPLSRGLPKTGQTTEVIAGDDGTYEKGWWLGRLNANNRTRFIEKELVSGEAVIIDLATRLMWIKNLTGAGCDTGDTKTLAECIAWCEALDYGGYDDWRMPNILEMVSLFTHNADQAQVPVLDFDNWVPSWEFWSSTTQENTLELGMHACFSYSLEVTIGPIISSRHFLPVRSV